jgi:hypothetical protein
VAQTQAENQDVPTGKTPKESTLSTGKKQSPMLWIIILVFIPSLLFAYTLLKKYYKGEPTDWWVKDYNAGIALAKRQNKPALLCFFKQGTRYSSDMWQNVYSKPEVKKYVEANFVPILIDVDKQPEIAERYNVTYYPTHYVEYPDANQIDGPFLGSFRLFEFIKKAQKFNQKDSSQQ